MQMTFIDHIKKFVKLSDAEEQILYKYAKSESFKKKENLLSNGKVCRSLYFVEKGCLRMFFINSKAAEQITAFALEGWWIADYFSFMQNQPSEYYIQAIEASQVLSIDIQVFDDLLKEIPQLERYFRIIMQKNIAASQLRTKYLYEMSPKDLLQHFTSSFPDFIERVPLPMVYSYLGICHDGKNLIS